MTDLVLRDLSPDLAGRLRRLAEAQGITTHAVLVEVLEQGLRACEDALRRRLDAEEEDALRRAISALQQVPDDPGFGLIGRLPAPPPQAG